MTVEVVGRRAGRLISFPVVVTDYAGERHLVSMLGDDANWVRNVRAAPGGWRCCGVDAAKPCAVKRLTWQLARPSCADTSPSHRAPGPACRWTSAAPLKEFERIAAQFPIFRVAATGPAFEGDATSRPRGPQT